MSFEGFYKKSALFFLALFFLAPSVSSAATFNRNLSQGSRGEDVVKLQKILNLFPETQVATSGPGSPKNETAVFGPATKRALIKFQNKYASEILKPAGLTFGTGYVGFYTLKKLEELAPKLISAVTPPQNQTPPTVPPPTTLPPTIAPQNPLVSTGNKAPVITGLLRKSLTLQSGPTKTSDGKMIFDNTDTITILGKNFTQSNTIIISTEKPIENVVSTDGVSLTFTFDSATTAGIRTALQNIPSDIKQTVINNMISKQAEKTTDPTLKNGLYVPFSISVKNANGISYSFPAVVNLAKGL